MVLDSIRWVPLARVDKFDPDAVAYVRSRTGLREPQGSALAHFCRPWETIEVEGNALTTAGLDRITKLIIGSSGNPLSATYARLGVGDDTTAFNASDTDLSTTTNQYYVANDSTYPQQSNGVITCKGTFTDALANFAWQCWGIDIGSANTAGSTANTPLVNRKVASLGTKASGSWVLTVTLTLS